MSDRPTLRDLLSRTQASTRAGASQKGEMDRMQKAIDRLGFGTAIVKDVISNPVDYLARSFGEPPPGQAFNPLAQPPTVKDALKNISSGAGVANSEMTNLVPRNSIIAFPTTSGDSTSNPVPEIFFPFFPPHLSFPVKPGESVWIFYENLGTTSRGYWLCRKPSFRQVDDVNFTAASREGAVAVLDEASNPDGTTTLDSETFEHTAALLNTFPRYANLPISPDDLVSDSIAYREEFVGEPVPRYTKKCGDFVIQGSNNTLISLGIDKSYSPDTIDSMVGVSNDLIDGDTYTSSFDTNQNSSTDNFRLLKPEMAGCIELVVGRGALDLKNDSGLSDPSISTLSQLEEAANLASTLGISFKDALSEIKGANNVTSNARSKASSLNHFEIEKGSDFTGNENESPIEGDFNTFYDSDARFYVSMRSTPNAKAASILQLNFPDVPDIADSVSNFFGEGKSAIVSTAYSIKNYARGNCEFQSALGGAVHVSDGVILGSAGGAYIHLKNNGDISIVPGPNGTIKIGGEDASLAVLGNDNLVEEGGMASDAGPIQLAPSGPGAIKGTPITSTAGGTVGMAAIVEAAAANVGGSTPAPNGKFATKILIK